MAADKDKHVRSILPVPDVRKSELTAFDAKDPESRFPPIEPMPPPKGAPNVLAILLDDVGCGSSSAFGGPCDPPVAEQLAANGLKFTRFHTCAPAHRDGAAVGAPHHPPPGQVADVRRQRHPGLRRVREGLVGQDGLKRRVA